MYIWTLQRPHPGLETLQETKEEELPEADWDEADPAIPELSDNNDSDDDFHSAFGETIESIVKEKQECGNCGLVNSLQDLYCSS